MKKMVYAFLALGWIPTILVVTAARWVGGQSLLAQGSTPVKVTRLYTGPDGKTKVEEFEIPVKPREPGIDVSRHSRTHHAAGPANQSEVFSGLASRVTSATRRHIKR